MKYYFQFNGEFPYELLDVPELSGTEGVEMLKLYSISLAKEAAAIRTSGSASIPELDSLNFLTLVSNNCILSIASLYILSSESSFSWQLRLYRNIA